MMRLLFFCGLPLLLSSLLNVIFLSLGRRGAIPAAPIFKGNMVKDGLVDV